MATSQIKSVQNSQRKTVQCEQCFTDIHIEDKSVTMGKWIYGFKGLLPLG